MPGVVAAWATLALIACAAAPKPHTASSPAAPARLEAMHYTVALDAAHKRLDVELCFEGQPPARLMYGSRDAVAFTVDPQRIAGDGRKQPVLVKDGLMQLPSGAPGDCVRYGVDVQRALDRDALLLAYPGEESLLLAAELFLWRPPVRSPELRTTLRFVLPAGMRASAPWREAAGEPGAYLLDERAFAFTGHVVLGHFDTQALSAPGARLRLVTMQGFPAETAARIAPWLQRAAKVASLPGAQFPVPQAQVIVVPTSPSPYPIYFGHTGRSGGASIVLFLPTDADEQRLRDDWIAIHEFSHLWHPFVLRQDAWLSEGIATYLQEVLRARAGLISAEQLWQRLYEGAELGRQSSRSLGEETLRMPFEHNYQRVYWAGATIALLMDIELRTKSRGQVSLDALLARLRKQSKWYMRARSAEEILHALDSLADMPVCEALADRYVQGELPDPSQLFIKLGLPEGGVADTPRRPAAPLAWVRDAIQAGSSDLAAARTLGGG